MGKRDETVGTPNIEEETMPETEAEKTKRLLIECVEHLNYCGWGDSWEQEGSVKLRKEVDDFMEEIGVHNV